MKREKVDYAYHLSCWESSGLKKLAYCKLAGISYQGFLYHQKRKLKESLPQDFVKIDYSGVLGAAIEFHYPDGRFFVFPVGCPVAVIKSVLA